MRTDIFTAAAALAIGSANAFWGMSHLLVSRRAQDLLMSQDYAAYEAVLAELQTLKDSQYDYLTEDEDKHPMTECATFADNIKSQGYSFQSGWHFKDQPYLNEGGSLDDYSFVQDPYDAVDALTSMTEWLSNSGTAYKSSYYYKQIKQRFSNEAEARSFALRLVIHYVGDIHQPLHAVTLINDTYPSGDRGGNDEKLPSKDSASNLHAVWDSLMYEYSSYASLPMSDSTWSWYTNQTQQMASAYPIDKSNLHEGDFQYWASESLQLAETNAYPGVVVNEPLSDDYINENIDVLKTQVMYAGYRLNKLMQQIYGSNNDLFLQ